MHNLSKKEIQNQLEKHLNKAMLKDLYLNTCVFKSIRSMDVIKHNEGNLTKEVCELGVWFIAQCQSTNALYEIHSNIIWASCYYDPKHVSFSDFDQI